MYSFQSSTWRPPTAGAEPQPKKRSKPRTRKPPAAELAAAAADRRPEREESLEAFNKGEDDGSPATLPSSREPQEAGGQ